jgi:hypothetical protein
MGFLFRLCFWLGVAAVIMPPEGESGPEGLGHAGAVNESFSDKFRLAAYSAWNFAAELGRTCDTNPELCQATRQLVSTAADTGQSLIVEIHEAVTHKDQTTAAPDDGRVSKGQNPGG